MPITPSHVPPDPGRTPGAETIGGITRRQMGALALLWLAATAALLLFRPGYTFPPYELLDSWIYTSYQWDLKNQIADFGPTYYGSRLSWILPGALLHSLLSPVAANLCYKLVVSALLATACGSILYRAAGMSAAMLAVGLSVCAPQIIVALHTDYVDTPVIVYAALTLACITAARNSPRWAWWVFLGGCCFAGMLVTNLSSIGTPGLGIAVFHLLWLRWGFRRQLACVGLYLLAAALVVLVIAGIHVWAGGAFYFLKPQVGMMLYFHDLKPPAWTAARWAWLQRATWLVLPVSVLLWGARASLRQPTAGNERRRLIMALTAALGVSFAWAIQVEIKGVEVLSLYYYASYHLCFALPLLAALCCHAPDTGRESPVRTGLLVAALLLFSLLGQPLGAWTSLVPLHRYVLTPESMPWLVAGALLLVGLLTAVKILSGALRRFCRPEFMVLGLLACSTSSGFHGREISDRLRERYLLVYQTYHLVAREFPRSSYIYWVHADERNGISLASTKLWGYRMMTDQPFPDMGVDPLRFIDRIVIMPCPPGRGPGTLVAAAKTLASAGIDMVAPRLIPVQGAAGLGFDLACFSMKKHPFDPEYLPVGAKPPVMLLAFLSHGDSSYVKSLGFALADPQKGPALDMSRGYPVFTPSVPQDHVATQPHFMAPGKPGQTRQLSVVTFMPAAGSCFCTIQDENFNHLGHLRLTEAGRAVHRIDVPPGSTKLRVVFECPEQPSTPLPTDIRFYEIPN